MQYDLIVQRLIHSDLEQVISQLELLEVLAEEEQSVLHQTMTRMLYMSWSNQKRIHHSEYIGLWCRGMMAMHGDSTAQQLLALELKGEVLPDVLRHVSINSLECYSIHITSWLKECSVVNLSFRQQGKEDWQEKELINRLQQMTSLRTLTIGAPTDVPSELSSLTNLTRLTIYGELSSIPANVLAISSLRELKLYRSTMKEASEQLGEFFSLFTLEDGIPQFQRSLDLEEVSNAKLAGIAIACQRDPSLAGKIKSLGFSVANCREIPDCLVEGQITELDLNGKVLTSLPENLPLKRFDGSPELWAKFSKQILTMTKLETLNLKNCEMDILPKEIGNLKQLYHLDLSFNRLLTLPSEMRLLPVLKRLDLVANPWQNFPAELAQLSSVSNVDCSLLALCVESKNVGKKVVEQIIQRAKVSPHTPQILSSLSLLRALPMTSMARAFFERSLGQDEPEEFSLIPACTFWMGSNDVYHGNASNSPFPRHRVTLSRPFLMSKYLVTQSLWASVMGSNSCTELEYELPVSNISWCDALLFCNRLSEMHGLTPVYQISEELLAAIKALHQTKGWTYSEKRKVTDLTSSVTQNVAASGYRLPTEAEWELAARGPGVMEAQKNRKLSQTAIGDPTWGGNDEQKKHPVGKNKANGFGLFDVLGNVHEWVWDSPAAYVSEDISRLTVADIKGKLQKKKLSTVGKKGVLVNRLTDSQKTTPRKNPTHGVGWLSKFSRGFRGGSYKQFSTVFARYNYSAGEASADIGFRICRTVQ